MKRFKFNDNLTAEDFNEIIKHIEELESEVAKLKTTVAIFEDKIKYGAMFGVVK